MISGLFGIMEWTKIPSNNLEQIKADIVRKYEQLTPISKKNYKEAVKWLPGGETRNISHFYPYPFYPL